AAIVLAPLLTEHPADLADRAVLAEGLAHRRKHVLSAAGCLTDTRERRRSPVCVPLRSDPCGAFELPLLGRGIDRLQLDLLLLLGGVFVHADDDAFPGFDL